MRDKTILVVDDETRITILIKDFLEAEGFHAISASNGKEALEIFTQKNDTIDLVILDVMMPEIDGWTVCREIRKKSNVPVLMLTARSEDYDEVHGFEIGADDYVKKPVRPIALMARIQAMFRRIEREGRSSRDQIAIGDLIIDKDSHIVTIRGEEIYLSPKEYTLMIMLIENSGKVISREQLLNHVWGYDYFGGLRTVDTHINRLRSKLDGSKEMITTVRGFGYRFEVEML